MNIPSAPAAPAGTPPPVQPGHENDKGASGHSSGQMVQLVDSGIHADQSQWQIGELNRQLLTDPDRPREVTTSMNKTTSIEGRLKLALSSLDAHHNRSSFAGKIRLLAQAIMKLFTHTRPDTVKNPAAADRPAARNSPYGAIAARVDAAGGRSPDAAQVNLNLLAEFHQASRIIPEISGQMAEGSSSKLASNPALLAEPLNRLANTAAALQHLQGDSIRSVLDSDPDFKIGPGADRYAADLKKEKLKLNVESAAGRLASVLDEPYLPRNPELIKLAESLPEGALRFSQFGNLEGNPYQKLSDSPHFGKQEDLHLRNWMSQALAIVAKCSQTIDAAMLENDTSLHVTDIDMNNLRRLGGDQIQGLETAV